MLAAALKFPQLFRQKPETLNGKVKRSATLLGLTKPQFIAAALKQPPLFYQKPETLSNNAERSTGLLGLTKEQFRRMALRRPSLFCLTPETFNENVERSAELLGLTKLQFMAVALKQVSLFYQKPETLSNNAERSTRLLGITREQFKSMALRWPQYFVQKPETLNENVERSAVLLGLTKEQFVTAAVKRAPSLFCMKPETLGVKKRYILKICKGLAEPKDFAGLIQTAPYALLFSCSRLRARYILAKLGLTRGAFSTVVRISNAEASTLIVDHFMKQIERSGKGIRALRIMYAHGLIATLPASIAPIERLREEMG